MIRPNAYMRVRTVQVCFSVTENTHMSVVGDGVFKMYRYTDGGLRQFAMQKADFPHFVCHAWLTSDLLLAGTIDGRLIAMDSAEYKREYTVVAENQLDSRSVAHFAVIIPCSFFDWTQIAAKFRSCTILHRFKPFAGDR